jgi:hypothetical protein
MGFADIEWGELSSIRTRINIIGGLIPSETRTIQNNEETDEEGNPILGFLAGIWDKGVKFAGWLWQTVTGAISWTIGSLWSLLVTGFLRLYQFNWNATDSDLDAQLEALRLQVASQLGGTIGNTLGYLVCGVVPGALLLKVNKPMAVYILTRLGEEAADEFMGNIAALLRTTANYALQWAVIGAYKNTRKVAREFFKDPTSPQSVMLENLFGENAQDWISQWGTARRAPWSFRLAVEEYIDGIKDPFWQNFFEEMHEEFLEACMEAGYVAGNAMDEWIFQQKLQQMGELGQQRVVEITPDRSVEDETIIVAGSEQLVRTQIPQILATYRMIEDRDIGQIVGEPARENIRDLISPLTLRLIFKTRQNPPFIEDDGRQSKQTQITLPFINRSKLDWEDIKEACGGKNGYLWGRFKALVKLENGHSFELWGGSKDECEDRVTALLKLITVDMVGITITEETKKGKRLEYSALYKETRRIYPCYFTLFNNQKVLNEDSGKATLSGVYKSRKYRFDLWTEKKPENYQEDLNELLRTRSSNFGDP